MQTKLILWTFLLLILDVLHNKVAGFLCVIQAGYIRGGLAACCRMRSTGYCGRALWRSQSFQVCDNKYYLDSLSFLLESLHLKRACWYWSYILFCCKFLMILIPYLIQFWLAAHYSEKITPWSLVVNWWTGEDNFPL